MSETFQEKLRSLHFSKPAARGSKTTVDESGNRTVEHWDDRVDVTVKAPSLRVHPSVSEER